MLASVPGERRSKPWFASGCAILRTATLPNGDVLSSNCALATPATRGQFEICYWPCRPGAKGHSTLPASRSTVNGAVISNGTVSKSDIAPLEGRSVLDVGCGNAYYAMQMRIAGARAVIGIDPTLLYIVQFLAIDHFLQTGHVFVLPLRLHELPQDSRSFDTTFSMGVLYHQRSPIDHLRQLKGTLRTGGQLVLETIFVPGKESYACTPPDRYARMRNVWLLPTIAELTTWLRRSGFADIEVIDESVTTTDEQRSTEWMAFESLREALKPDDPDWTVEGWPAPRRVVVVAIAP